MHHPPELILTLAGALSASLGLGYLTHRLGLSTIVGYLLAGIAIGEYTPGFRADKELAEQLAEVGVILLMFGVGLHFHLDELLAVRRIAIPGAVGQSLVATVLGAIVAWAIGWGWTAGVVYGLALSVASTVVLTRVLSDANALHTPTGHIAIGWLVVEDLFTVLVLVLLPVVFEKDEGGGIGLAVGLAVVKITALMLVAFPVGGRVIPWILTKVAETKSRELFTLTVLVVALGIAVGSAALFGVSMALGAFLAGMVVGRSEFSLRAAGDALPMRDAFAVLFFVSVGMRFDPAYLITSPGVVIATLAVVMVGKPLAALLIVRIFGYPVRVAFSVAVALGQIGEFSFILADMGSSESVKVLPKEVMNALVAVAILSISVNPLLYQGITPLERWLQRRVRLWRWLNARVKQPGTGAGRPADADNDPRFRAVVVGYGPVGRTLVRLLRENGIAPTVVEMNVETVRRLKTEGTWAVYGDVTRRETLKEAGVEKAASLILSASSITGLSEVIRIARELNPNIRVLARTSYLRERSELFKVGADAVFAAEGEIALAMGETVLRELGASPDQIDRERERVRTELFGELPSVAATHVPQSPNQEHSKTISESPATTAQPQASESGRDKQ